LSKLFGF